MMGPDPSCWDSQRRRYGVRNRSCGGIVSRPVLDGSYVILCEDFSYRALDVCSLSPPSRILLHSFPFMDSSNYRTLSILFYCFLPRIHISRHQCHIRSIEHISRHQCHIRSSIEQFSRWLGYRTIESIWSLQGRLLPGFSLDATAECVKFSARVPVAKTVSGRQVYSLPLGEGRSCRQMRRD